MKLDQLFRPIIWHFKTTSLVLRLEICFKTVLIMSSWQKKLISYVIFYFCYYHHKSVSGLQITDQSCEITSCHHFTRGIAGPNFKFIPSLELEVYAQRANLCFSKALKKIAFHFSKSKLDQCIEIFFVQVHASVLMMPFFCLFSRSGCYYSGDDTPFFNANTIGTFVDISLLDRWLIETTY